MRPATFMSLLTSALALTACTKTSALYCSEDKPCTDPARPYCDLTGEFDPGGHANTCVPDPFGDPDAGRPDARVSDVDGAIGGDDAAGPEVIAEVSAGSEHTCARTSYGRVRCWGARDALGIESDEHIGDDEVPAVSADVPLPEPAVQISAGGDHTCALTTSQRVVCWGGKNQFGQLGLAEPSNPLLPTEFVPLPEPATLVSAGAYLSCARLVSGDVQCWGRNDRGQLGIGSLEVYGDDEPPTDAPKVGLQGPAESVSAGKGQTVCAVLEGGSLSCWGEPTPFLGGEAEEVTEEDLAKPGELVNIGSLVGRVAVARYHQCVQTPAGRARCWGSKYNGSLGLASGSSGEVGDDPGEMPPDDVQTGGTVLSVGAAFAHTCALLEGGGVRCWGTKGLLGTQAEENIGDDEHPSTTPFVDLGAPAAQLSVGVTHACVLTKSASVRCWGMNSYGSLGYATDEFVIGDDESPASWGDVQVFPDLAP